jgi:hypothetical protein
MKMTFTTLISTIGLIFIGCSFGPDSDDAPELNLSNGEWVNELKYDGVITLRLDMHGITWGEAKFNGAAQKALDPLNGKTTIKNGFWFDPELTPHFDIYRPSVSRIGGFIKVNDLVFDTYSFTTAFGRLKDNKKINYVAETGLKIEVAKVEMPRDEIHLSLAKLTPADAPSFLMIKDGIKVFPTSTTLEKEYHVSTKTPDLKIDFVPPANADLIYVKFSDEGFYYAGDLGTLQANGFIKSYKPDQSSITISKHECDLFLKGRSQVTMNIMGVKFYSHKNKDGRSFLIKNIAESKATVFID